MDDTWPTQSLLFFISDDLHDDSEERMGELIESLANQRQWIIGPPEFVDDSEVAEGETIRTLGGVLTLYSARGPAGTPLPIDIDRAGLDEVTALVQALTRFSAENDHEIEFELDGEQVGWIEHGAPTRSLQEGLLDEWAAELRRREAAGSADA